MWLFLFAFPLCHGVTTEVRQRLGNDIMPMDIELNAFLGSALPNLPNLLPIYTLGRLIYTRAYFIGNRLGRLGSTSESPVVISLKQCPTSQNEVRQGWAGWAETCIILQITFLLVVFCKFIADVNPFAFSVNAHALFLPAEGSHHR